MSMIRFDTYYRYTELTEILQGWATEYPHLCRLSSLGESHEGRTIWVLTLTNVETGPDTEKPGYWVDANIHATELATSVAALYLINKLLTQYGTDEKVTYALDSRVFYIAPRLSPDGVEAALGDVPHFVRSNTKPYPREDQLDGFIMQDIDQDGHILQMRVRDPHGGWKQHPEEARLLIRREPDDLPHGDYYRLFPEGTIQNYDGVLIPHAPRLHGLDLNRNFPFGWSPEQLSGGTYPGSEPEALGVLKFITEHTNITGGVTLHTFSGVHLRPPTKGPDSDLPTPDLHTYQKMGEKAEALTGYPAICVFKDFAYDSKKPTLGTFDDWLYEQIGVYAWTTEIWSVQKQAGIEVKDLITWWRDHPAEHDLKMLRWFEENVKQTVFHEWKPFTHPQLGEVELGGWERLHSFRNPPLELMEKEVAPLADFCLFNCLVAPKLELYSVDVVSEGTMHRVRLVVQNTGWLPTNVTQQALAMKRVLPLEVDIVLPEDARLVLGDAKQFGAQLMGRDHIWALSVWAQDATDNRAKFEWVVNAPVGTEINLIATHQRAGVVRTAVTL